MGKHLVTTLSRSTAANAGVVTLNNVFSLNSGFTSTTNYSEANSTSVYFDAFDISLGTLTSVHVTVDSEISGSSFVGVGAGTTSEGAMTNNFSDHFFEIFGIETRVKRDFEGGALCISGDGSVSHDSCFNLVSHNSEAVSGDLFISSLNDLDNFSTGDPWSVTFRTILTASWLVAPDNGTLGAGRSFAGNITVVYNYNPVTDQPTPVPAPASFALILLGLTIVAVQTTCRRRR